MRATSFTRLRVEQLEARETPATLPGFSETVFASGLNAPTAMTVAPDGRIFVTEKGGTLRIVQGGSLLSTPFLTVSVNTVSERGLDGVALDPNFATNGFVYVYYTTSAATPVNRISRFTADPAKPNVALAGSEVVLLDNIPSTNGNHNGGSLLFGADGKLYAGIGDSGVSSNAQSLSTLAGKLLRINPNGSIPTDNPFVGTSGARGEIWALGLRNPFTMAIQPGTGQIFINDVGQNSFEEIDQALKGANYGWPNVEGDTPPGVAGVTYPIYTYSHGTGPLQGGAISGGAFYNPTAPSFPAQYVGDYYFGDFVSGRIFVRDSGTGAVTPFAEPTAGSGVVDLDVLPDGRLLYLSINSGAIYQIASTGAAVSPSQLIAVGPGAGKPSQIAVLNADGGTRFTLTPYAGYGGAVHVATGDVNGDGVEDIITGTAPGAPPHVKVFDGVTGAQIMSFYAFDPGFLGGLNVAAGDLNGDGRADIIVGTASGAAHVKAFDAASGALVRSFIAYDGFAGGVTVAAGDVDGDNHVDIITGSALGASHVKAFSGTTGALIRSFLAYGGFTGGVNVGYADGTILTGTATFSTHVKAFAADGTLRLSFYAFSPVFPGGVRVAGNGGTILAGAGPGAGPHLKGFDLFTGAEVLSRFAFDPSVPGGIFVG
jgi:glucose/arabinose dehydrogenase